MLGRSIAVVAYACATDAAASTASKRLINDPEHIKNLNSKGSSWVAGPNSFFDGMTLEDARPLLGTALSHIADHMDKVLPESHYASNAAIPTDFDARTQWPSLIHPVRDQQRCGSCWAFSSSEVLSDRVAIATGRPSPVLSPEDMVSCDTGDVGCQGGSLPGAWAYLTSTGIVSDACSPYTAGSGTAPSCTKQCVDGENWNASIVKASSSYAIDGVEHMQQDIMTKGPIQIGFKVYASFMSYQSGVYKKHADEMIPEGGHAVKIVGWGVDGGEDYWWVANSWGPNWGLDGFFKMKRGVDECGVETMGPPYAGTFSAIDTVMV